MLDAGARIVQLETELRVEQLKNKASLANNLCPDCRDKQAFKSCLGCTIQRLETELATSKAQEAILHDRLRSIYALVEGDADGTIDATDHEKFCNRIVSLTGIAP